MTTAHAEVRPVQRSVLVALSATGTPQGAIETGRVIAGALSAPLHGVLVWPTSLSPADVPRLLRLEPAAIKGMVIDVEVGDPAERLSTLACADPIAFVVLAADDDGRDACRVGEIAARALARATAGAIIVRSGASLSRLERILVPLDGTPSTASALGPAGELAKRAGASLDVVLIEDCAAPSSHEHGAMMPVYVDQPQHEWPAFSEEFMHRFVGAIGHCPHEVPTRFHLGMGRPASEILRFARELRSDLITLVWNGGCAGDHGAVFRDVVRGSPRPVLVLRR